MTLEFLDLRSLVNDRKFLFVGAACVLVVLYAVAIFPILKLNNYDPSIFIDSSSHYVDATKTPSKIRVRKDAGYDGMFYYRMAMDPFSRDAVSNGVSFDNAPYRMQRILYPMLSKIVSLGNNRWMPLSLLFTNFLGLIIILGVSWRITDRWQLPKITPIALALWPGFLVTVTKDTTEIWSAACLLIALKFYLEDNLIPFIAAAAAATFARETNLAVFAGLFAYEAFHRRWRRAAALVVCVLPFLWYRHFIEGYWGASASAGIEANLALPFFGYVQKIWRIFDGTTVYYQKRWAISDMLGIVLFLVFWVYCTIEAVRRFRGTGAINALAFAWLPIAATVSILSAMGPLVEPSAYLRAFTECYIVGCLLIALKNSNRTQEVVALLAAFFWVDIAFFAFFVVGTY